MDGVRDVENEHKPYDISSDASNHNILNDGGNVNNSLKEAGSRGGTASFSEDGHIMEEISREIHERFTHKGGLSLSKGKE